MANKLWSKNLIQKCHPGRLFPSTNLKNTTIRTELKISERNFMELLV